MRILDGVAAFVFHVDRDRSVVGHTRTGYNPLTPSRRKIEEFQQWRRGGSLQLLFPSSSLRRAGVTLSVALVVPRAVVRLVPAKWSPSEVVNGSPGTKLRRPFRSCRPSVSPSGWMAPLRDSLGSAVATFDPLTDMNAPEVCPRWHLASITLSFPQFPTVGRVAVLPPWRS
jgi:hypothetical protein